MTAERSGWRRWLDFTRQVKTALDDNHVSLAAAGVAFYTLLALFPGIVALVTTYALVADPAQVGRQLDPVVRVLPPDAASLLVRQLTAAVQANSGGLSFGLVISLAATIWAATGGMNALITGLNIVHDVQETRNFLKLRALALGLTFGAAVTMVVALGLVAAFPVALRWLGLDPVAEVGAQVVRWLLLVVLVGLGLGVVYRWAPDRRVGRRRWVTTGAVVALVVWLAASAGFSVYVSYFGSYNKTYGSLAAVIVLLLWLYLSAFAVLLGAEIDAVIEARNTVDQPRF